MPATPAWPPQSAPRLYVDAPLGEGATIPLDGAQAHYLISVMRVKEGDIILLFDNRTGEWAAEARNIRKSDIALHIVRGRKSVWSGKSLSVRSGRGGSSLRKQKTYYQKSR